MNAQDERKIYFTGLARVEVKNSAANGNAYNGDTASINRSTSGATLFDLGAHIQPTDYLRITSIVRLRNEFGAFFGQGSGIELRQLKLEGLIAKSIKYELGDIDVGMTPFTVYNFEDTSFFESSLFSLRRNIANYENLNETSDWRLQGAKAKSLFFWGDTSATSELALFGVRTKQSEDTIPNQFLVGASLMNSYKSVRVGLNYVRFFEPQDVESLNAFYANDVMTTSLDIVKEEESYALDFHTEAGLSFFNREMADSAKRKRQDGFVITGLEAKLKKVGIKFGARYRYTGPGFYSAAAQTMHIDNTSESALFTYQSQGAAIRPPLLFDRYTEPNMYNGTLSPTLMLYLPQYGNVLPYGDATPNRQGVSFSMGYSTADNVLCMEAESHFLSEVAGKYDRKLMQYKLGGMLRLDSLLNTNKALVFKASYRNEQTTSTTDNAIDFNTNLVDMASQIEVFKHFNLLVGWKWLGIKGGEYIVQYDALNKISAEQQKTWDEKQQWLALGLQYNFSTKSFFTVHSNYVMYNNTLDSRTSYNINQYYLNYTLRF